MSAQKKGGKRDVIPRWRRSQDIATHVDSVSPTLATARRVTAGVTKGSLDVLADFEDSRKPLIWAEALSSALTVRDFDSAINIVSAREDIDLTRFPVLEAYAQEQFIRQMQAGSGHDLVNESTSLDLQGARRAIRVYDSNALAWLDLARAYAINGDLGRAERAVWTGLHFDPDTRWVVRAAARFFVHQEDLASALRVIERASGFKIDPWLVSAHIAVSHAAGKTSALMRRARSLFEDDNFRPKHVSELGMALATVEIESSPSGSRGINKLARRALRDPTENAVAQAEWVESIWGKELGAQNAAQTVQNAFEARAKELSKEGAWEKAAKETFRWLCDQPFSSRPAIDGSYIAATFLGDFALAEKFAEVGFRANPEDLLVRNNYAVALAELGKIQKARKVFGSLGDSRAQKNKETYRATEGLLRYREGKIDSARECYEEARQSLELRSELQGFLVSLTFQAAEEVRVGNYTYAAKLIEKGEILVERSKRTDLRYLTDLLRQKREKLEVLEAAGEGAAIELKESLQRVFKKTNNPLNK